MCSDNTIYKLRNCWNCKRPLSFEDFSAINQALGKCSLIELWQNSNLEFYCCNCYKKYWSKNLNRKNCIEKKVILAGISDSGKTSLLTIIKKRNIKSINHLTPTRGINRDIFEHHDLKYYIFEVSGIYYYRNRIITRKSHIFLHTDELIFVFDITDESSFEEAIQYLDKILNVFRSEEIKNTLAPDFSIFILFHKYDPLKIEILNLHKNIELLRVLIDEPNIEFKYNIFPTSIYYYTESKLDSLINQREIKGFGNFMIKLFSANN